ncbi:hypothetical protein QCA50_009675 [Cerrena zonata]|uniref:TPR-like protein n=1 Tax=Cerrena zonata TaxID=2478898 RepID=A0AAW0G1S8_9APHY
MALPLLVNGGAECGPSNALQGLSKKLDQDRGIQQDYFGASRAGSSRETFRTQYAAAPGVEHDAAKFFSTNQSPAPMMAGPSAFDLSALHTSLPDQAPQHHFAAKSLGQSSSAPWASDFVQQQNTVSATPQPLLAPTQQPIQHDQHSAISSPISAFQNQNAMPWSPATGGMVTRFNGMMYNHPGTLHPASQVLPFKAEDSRWEVAFQSQEASLTPAPSVVESAQVSQPLKAAQESSARPAGEADELARTAGVLLETVKNEQNPKFKKSQFLGLMRQVRDREVVIEGSDMVQKTADSTGSSSWATDFQQTVDTKGKGRAAEALPLSTSSIPSTSQNFSSASFAHTAVADSSRTSEVTQEDPNDAYFRQDNEEYIKYWNNAMAKQETSSSTHQASAQQSEWAQLQQDWDSFEATATGLRPVANYQFQPSNPYLLGDSSRTRHHAMHAEGRSSLYESVLEMEAAVQRNRTDALAWYELGVKQQENEREQKAITALRRALELDPTHLPSWLALAVSHTNEGSRFQTYNAIRQWVEHNEKYRSAVYEFTATHPEREDMTNAERFESLAQCLMTMARSDISGEIDADIQIALAILLNANDEYMKARDCFITALAVRPDDWLLYNRVGATLANGGHPEEALQYYYRALELNPTYIRALFNLGISCVNLRRYEQAAQSILDALVLQDSDSAVSATGVSDDKRGVTSDSLWDALRTCCLHMQRIDLVTICDRRDVEAFQLNFQMAA